MEDVSLHIKSFSLSWLLTVTKIFRCEYLRAGEVFMNHFVNARGPVVNPKYYQVANKNIYENWK
jgi:hypothetical protein